MPGPPERHERLRNLATAVLVLAYVGGVVAIVSGISLWFAHGAWTAGAPLIVAGLAVILVAVLLYCQVVLIQRFTNYAYRAYDVLLEAADLLRRQEEHSRTIAENSNLSDWAKRVVYREKDYEFLRDAIQGAVIRQDWESAEHLIRDVETVFGYRDEAAKLRETLEQARRSTTEERIAAALARFELLCSQRKWEQARTECERLAALFPGYTAIAELPRQIERRRQEIKQQLLKDYDQAVRGEDVDRAHRLLFELDQYLVPKEAEALKESARGVFRARLEQLKTRFTLAVSYKQFPSAIEAGEQLIREFPNSGYAQEISKLLPVLRQRAGQAEAGTPTSPTAS
ncbi:MAG: hypothetical protein AB1601_14590 [Planctomycetota bacterium]